jgi:hypothetical protein
MGRDICIVIILHAELWSIRGVGTVPFIQVVTRTLRRIWNPARHFLRGGIPELIEQLSGLSMAEDDLGAQRNTLKSQM